MFITLKGQVAVITGGNSGIGRAISLQFARSGASVVVNYHSNEEQAKSVVDDIRRHRGKAIAVQGDVGKEDDVERLFSEALAAFGVVDILVANSGMQKDAAFADMSLDDWQAVLNTNLTGQFLCARAAVKLFRKQGRRGTSHALGKIICMSSVHQHIPWAGHVNYAASKGGVALLMSSLAQEVAAEGIRVNAIAPGAIRTPINRDVHEGEKAKALLNLIPYKRMGEPDDIAQAATFLASDLADYIVGTTLVVDGGMSLYPGFEENG